jgi:hypothetical protein
LLSKFRGSTVLVAMDEESNFISGQHQVLS